MRPSGTARRYAEAAFDVARQDGEVGRWLEDLRTATDRLQEHMQYFKDPKTSMDQKLEALGRVFGNLRPHVLNLLRILASRHRIHLLPQILMEFEQLDREARGIAEAEVTVARNIDDGEKRIIADRLGQFTGKTVEMHTVVRPEILGGVVVRIGDRLIDASVAGRLQRLRQNMVV